MNLTRKQWILIAIIIGVMVVDTCISLYGAWFQTSNFYEANPLFAAIGMLSSVENFTIGLILVKVIGMGLVIGIISVCNTISEKWGNATCYLGVMVSLGSIITLLIFNIWNMYMH